MYMIEVGNGFFSGFTENLVTFVLDEIPGAMKEVKIFTDKEKANKVADQIGGKVVLVRYERY